MKVIFLLSIITLVGLTSCKKKGCTDSSAINYNGEAKKDDGSCEYTNLVAYRSQIQDVKLRYAEMALIGYSEALSGAEALKLACDNFVMTPTDVNFQEAKNAWLAARELYGQTEIFRFVEGPIDNASNGPEGLINAWPLDEAYIDYVIGSPNSGIINNVAQYPTINFSTLIKANENGGEENISVGYHAIEFLLWGQDVSANSAGTRPYTDFVTSGSASNQERRGQYLQACCAILVQGLEQVKGEWATGSNNYRAEWLAMDDKLALRKIINSIRVMAGTELSGERIFTAYDNADQEDEHSCFSDNTHRDIALNAAGIKMLFTGSYTSTTSSSTGYSLYDLVGLINPTLASEMLALQNTSKLKIENMYIPFDQAIILPAERPKVLESVFALQAEEAKILQIASLFSIEF